MESPPNPIRSALAHRAAAVLAFVIAAHGCGPKAKPVRLGSEGTPAARPSRPRSTPGQPDLLIGAICPAVAAGRPAVRPLWVRAGIWRGDDQRAERLVAARSARQFSALSWLGKRAGVLAVAGAARSRGATFAVGSYAGALPCEGEEGAVIPACTAAALGCGVAIARLEPAGGLGARPFDEDPEPIEIEPAAVCIDSIELAVDIDRDGKYEIFPRSAFAKVLPAELVAQSSVPRSCETHGGAAINPESTLLAATDLDGDGRVELVVSHRRGSELTWGLYRSLQTPVRLERVVMSRYSVHSHSSAPD